MPIRIIFLAIPACASIQRRNMRKNVHRMKRGRKLEGSPIKRQRPAVVVERGAPSMNLVAPAIYGHYQMLVLAIESTQHISIYISCIWSSIDYATKTHGIRSTLSRTCSWRRRPAQRRACYCLRWLQIRVRRSG